MVLLSIHIEEYFQNNIIAQMTSENYLHFSLVLANFLFSRYGLSYPCELHRDLEKPLAKLKRKYICHVGFQHKLFVTENSIVVTAALIFNVTCSLFLFRKIRNYAH